MEYCNQQVIIISSRNSSVKNEQKNGNEYCFVNPADEGKGKSNKKRTKNILSSKVMNLLILAILFLSSQNGHHMHKDTVVTELPRNNKHSRKLGEPLYRRMHNNDRIYGGDDFELYSNSKKSKNKYKNSNMEDLISIFGREYPPYGNVFTHSNKKEDAYGERYNEKNKNEVHMHDDRSYRTYNERKEKNYEDDYGNYDDQIENSRENKPKRKRRKHKNVYDNSYDSKTEDSEDDEYVNPSKYTDYHGFVTSTEITYMLNNLDKLVRVQDMLTIFNHVMSNEKKKFDDLQDHFIVYAIDAGKKYSVPNRPSTIEWSKIHRCSTKSINDFKKKMEKSFYYLIKKGAVSREYFIDFIKHVLQASSSLREYEENHWKKFLNYRLQKYSRKPRLTRF
ncbi:Plasmodium exported protein (PHIST), unknown function [Plasmodium ovale wallikeri]|uniref:Plasmodium RESA N-terminal domain-containing protein n=2 Tax=Plasmodium ovale TaxID=36330 RepID=A0A1A8YYA2_PLAOA|nr:Plasmodium exported protein (PHIST), unknown function [Plasmodium ovale wallikeri]SBT57247.1 Plasmodium exported protein (PHIST), unknown function [Plasmodium ovale wallikeri]SBT72088.1 Plasmodium exported protein (PHIST), unknown function [Plasmodium ovale]